MSCGPTIDLTGLTGAVFLDRHGRFAKDTDAVELVRLYYGATSADMSYAAFTGLSAADKITIQESGSGAGLIVTEGKSNA